MRYVIQKEYGHEEYHGGIGLKEQFNQNEVIQFLTRKLREVREYVAIDTEVMDRYNDELHREQFEMSMGTVSAIQEYVELLPKIHKTADTLLAIFREINKKAMITRNAVAILDSFTQDHFKELKNSGHMAEISAHPITGIELFKDGDLLNLRIWGEGASARLEASKININLDPFEEE